MVNTQRIEVDVALLRDLASQGKTDREIGNIFGCSPQVVGGRRRENNIPSGIGMHGKKPVDVVRIAELALLGWSDRAIGVELGRTENLIRSRRHELGIEPGNPHKRSIFPRATPEMRDPLFGYVSVRKADEEFARLMNGRQFSEIKFQPAFAMSAKPPSTNDRSVTGCAAAMCAR